MRIIDVYKLHSKQALIKKIGQLREQGKHPFSMAQFNHDDADWHGDPTYLLDSPIGYSTRPLSAIKQYLSDYHIIEVQP